MMNEDELKRSNLYLSEAFQEKHVENMLMEQAAISIIKTCQDAEYHKDFFNKVRKMFGEHFKPMFGSDGAFLGFFFNGIVNGYATRLKNLITNVEHKCRRKEVPKILKVEK